MIGYADVAELVDALASGASVSNDVEVQVLSSAPSEFIGNDRLFKRFFFIILDILFILGIQ